MSYRPRTKEQKSRRRYLADCKRHDVEPMPIEEWKKARISDYGIRCVADNTSNPSCKSVKPAKKMSYKPRTKEQKLRRKYLEDCKKNGIKPMPIEDWKKDWQKINDWNPMFANKTPKNSCKSIKPAKKERKIIVERGDVVIFKDYKPREIMCLAMLMLVDVYKEICASNSGHNHNS